jgi:hypothetical protein
MPLPPALASVRARPGMYLHRQTPDAVFELLLGYDLATMGGLLAGFREWLIPRVDGASNLAWTGLVETYLGSRGGVTIDAIFALVDELLTARDAHDGLRRIHAEYERWLRGQDWYDEQSPSWIPDRPDPTARSR